MKKYTIAMMLCTATLIMPMQQPHTHTETVIHATIVVANLHALAEDKKIDDFLTAMTPDHPWLARHTKANTILASIVPVCSLGAICSAQHKNFIIATGQTLLARANLQLRKEEIGKDIAKHYRQND